MIMIKIEDKNSDFAKRLDNILMFNEIKFSDNLIFERVMKICIRKNIITEYDKENNTKQFLWLKDLIEMKVDAMNLLDCEDREIQTFEQALNLNKNKELFVVEKIAEKIVEAIPNYLKR
ncbi:hypothetical protein CGK63_21920 [Vibrio parahaemolyticus]|nr:hypothetical protein CGK63_21920 [Vibrio parahaemolyticus]